MSSKLSSLLSLLKENVTDVISKLESLLDISTAIRAATSRSKINEAAENHPFAGFVILLFLVFAQAEIHQPGVTDKGYQISAASDIQADIFSVQRHLNRCPRRSRRRKCDCKTDVLLPSE